MHSPYAVTHMFCQRQMERNLENRYSACHIFFINPLSFFLSIIFNVISTTIFKKKSSITFIFWRCIPIAITYSTRFRKSHNYPISHNFLILYKPSYIASLLQRNENCLTEATSGRSAAQGGYLIVDGASNRSN